MGGHSIAKEGRFADGEVCVGVKRGVAWRTSLRVASLFRRVFGAVMYMSVRWTIEFL